MTMPLRKTQTRVLGHFGELVQGRIGPGGPLALITLPCPSLAATLCRAPGTFRLHQTGARVLAGAEAARLLRALGRPVGGAHVLRLTMPAGGGAGASTAARVALARAAGETDPARIAAACLASEGASDPLMFPDPERLLWAPREGRVLGRLPPLPRLEAVGGFFGPPRRTDPRDLAFPDVSDLLAEWPTACASAAGVARLAGLSAARTLALRGPQGDPTPALAARWGAPGWSIAHTGSARALLYAPGTVPAGLEGALRAEGFSRITRFRVGGMR